VIDELFDFFSNTIITTTVPQRSTDYEGGARIERGPTQASIGVFRLVSDDEIFFNPVGGFGFGANENLDGEGRRTGVELAASTLLGSVGLGGTYTMTTTAIRGGLYDGEEIPGVADHRLTLRALVPLPAGVSIAVEGLYVGGRRFDGDFEGAFPRQERYFLLDGRVAYSRGSARVFVDLRNLLGETHTEYGVLGGFPTERAFYPSPGRHVLAGADVRF
jgi:hypothetical protein